MAFSGESHLNYTNGNNEYSHHESSDEKSVNKLAAADHCEEVKEERLTFTQKSVTKRKQSKHRGNKQQLGEYAGTKRSEKRQLAGGDHPTERTIAKRNIVLSQLDPSQKSVLEEEMDQAKDKAALEHASIAQDIVTTVIKQSGTNLRKTLGICQKYLPRHFIDEYSEVHEHKLVQEVLSSVEEALISAVSCKDCVNLHKDLSGFLNWLVSGSSSHSCCIPVDKVHHNKNFFLFDPHHHMYGEQCNQSIGAINNEKLLNEEAMSVTTCKGPTKPSPMSFASVTHAPEEVNEMHNNPLRKEDQIRSGSARKRVQNTASLLGGE
uniref:Uncharacterized protein n=1 Tax=Rhodnius prolixus TaxID=13249 RepID=T1HR79_RHOPR